jgi:hypothetical protein
MPTIHLDAQVSPEELLDAVDQLGLPELDRFVAKVLALVARRKGPSLPPEEADLLLQINQGIPAELRARLHALGEKREDETLTPDEHQELLLLNDQVEALEATRLEQLTRLAELRGVSLRALLDQLGIHRPNHG